jgi:hypothetical protein
MIAANSAPGRDGMPDYRGYRYEVQKVEVADLFQGLVWPPGTHHAAPGLEIVPFALSADVAEQTVKEWIDRDLGKNTTTGGC